MRLLLPSLLLVLLCPSPARGQAWPQRRGSAYLKLSRSSVTAARQWDFDGTEKPYSSGVDGDAFFDRSVYLYAEYGLTDNLTLVALLPYKHLEVRDARNAFTTEGPGSVRLGVRVGLRSFFGVKATAPAMALNVTLTLPTGYTRNLSPSVGPGQMDVEAVFSYGLSLYPAYAQAGLGLRVRTGSYALSRAVDCPPRETGCVADARPAYADEWLFSGEVGLSLGRWALVQLLGQGIWSNQPPETGFNPLNPLPTRQRILKAGGGLTLYPLPRLGISLQAFATPFGRNTIRSTDWFLGVEYRPGS